jgi:hypothetical protein
MQTVMIGEAMRRRRILILFILLFGLAMTRAATAACSADQDQKKDPNCFVKVTKADPI